VGIVNNNNIFSYKSRVCLLPVLFSNVSVLTKAMRV